MPSKSKKHYKAASSSSSSSPSVTSSPSPYRTPNPDTELNADDFFGVLDEASRKFPSLISKSAFIGKVSIDASAVASVLHVLDSKGCKIWLSESAMLSSSITPGSIVSVSLASRKLSRSKPLCSLAEECAISFGFDYLENLVEAAGSYFALATVYPSSKLMKNAVCLSPSLLLTMGCPASGRIVFVHPVCNQPIIGTLNGYDKLEETICCSISLNNCKELHLSLVSSQSKFIMNGTMSSDIGLLGDIKNIQDENGNIASPQTPSFSQARLNSSRTSLLHTPNFQGSRSYLSHVEEKSTDTINISEILGDDNVRKLLQSCCASWLFSRYLLLGNFVVIPVLSRLCIFLAIRGNSLPTTGDFQNQTDKSNENLISCSPDLISCVNDAFLINHETKVYLLSSRDSVTQAPTGQASLSMAPVHTDSRTKKGITFPKLGALSKEFAVLKDIIVASAVKDDLASMGLRPTKGVLLHGPPGTGKTSLAKLCAHEAGVNLFLVHGPEIVSQYCGESERALHEVFDSARKALPSAVFIDELDAIAPARKHGGEELSQRMVATLLTLMDGMCKTDGLVVIAATNRLDTIEPALRRPGRFDREIEIGVPSPKQRLEILLSLLSEVQHTLLEEDVHHLAGVTHGFVGADLASLCNEAALVCLRRYIRMTTNGSGHNLENIAHDSCTGVVNSSFGAKCSEDCSRDDLDDTTSSISKKLSFSSFSSGYGLEVSETCAVGDHLLKVTVEDFEKARIKVRPSAMREVILEVPKVRWEDVGGQREVKMQLMEAVEWPQKHRDAFKRIGTQPPTGVLMFGPPGCSKTLLARAVASEAGLNFLAVKGPELFSKWVGESEKAVRSLFAKARANAPSIIFFDEIDGLAVIRGKESDGVSVSDRVMSQLLVELDGLHQRVNVTVIAATNRPDNIDPALLRPGRFDRLLYVGPPDRKDREDIFRVHLRKRPCSFDVCIKDLALLTEGYTGADISHVCNEASIRAIEENFNASQITMEHLKAGIELVNPSEIRSYEGLSNKFQRLVHSSAENVYDCQVSSTQQSQLSFWDFFRSIMGFHH